MTADQVAAIADHAGPYGLLVRFLAATGLRWVRPWDFIAETSISCEVRVIEQITEVGGRQIPGRPKTAKGRRVVPFPRGSAATSPSSPVVGKPMNTCSPAGWDASIKITADLYMHLFPDERTAADDRMDAMFAATEDDRAASTDAEVVEMRP